MHWMRNKVERFESHLSYKWQFIKTEIYGQKNVLPNIQNTETSFKQILTDFLTFMNINIWVNMSNIFCSSTEECKKLQSADDRSAFFGTKKNQFSSPFDFGLVV